MRAHFPRKLFPFFIVYIWSIFLSNCGLGKHRNDIRAADQHFMVGAKVTASQKIYVAQPQSILKSLRFKVDRLGKNFASKLPRIEAEQTLSWNERKISLPHETNNWMKGKCEWTCTRCIYWWVGKCQKKAHTKRWEFFADGKRISFLKRLLWKLHVTRLFENNANSWLGLTFSSSTCTQTDCDCGVEWKRKLC